MAYKFSTSVQVQHNVMLVQVQHNVMLVQVQHIGLIKQNYNFGFLEGTLHFLVPGTFMCRNHKLYNVMFST